MRQVQKFLQPVFKIFDLSQGLSLYAMDKQEINVTRLLVMLAHYQSMSKAVKS